MAQTIKLKRSATAGAAPTTSQLELGEVAINTYDGKMYIKKSVGGTESIVEISGGGGASAADAIFEEYLYTATNNQTAFSGNDDNSSFLSYVSGAIQVFLNGVLLDPETDYTATNGATVTLTSGAATNDYLQIIAFKKKIGDSSITIDTFSGNNSTTAFTLSLDPGDENNTRVFIDGVYQSKSNYAVSGTTLTFSSAPPSGTGIEVEIGNRAVSLDTASGLDLPDNVKLRLGTSQDLEIYHDGSHSYIDDAGTGNLYIRNGTKNSIFARTDGEVILYHNNANKLTTTSTGVDVTGNIVVSGTVDGRDVASDGAAAVAALPRTGGAMTGAITTNSTFDGRDVATDGAKLDGIEAGATADQTQSEINALGITATGLSGTPAISVANITTTGELRGPASLVIDPAAVGDNTGTVVIKGNLQVDGATTTINSTTLTVDDLNLTLASGAANGTAANGAGITIDGASATLTYNSTGDSWDFNKAVSTGNMTLSGQEIDVSSGNLTLDVASSIILDSDAGNIYLRDNGTDVGLLSMANTDVYIRSLVSNRDIIFQGYDSGSNITALTLDMSNNGKALFNHGATFASNVVVYGNANASLDWGDTSTLGQLTFDGSGNPVIRSTVSNKSLVIQGVDAGSSINALTLDMSAAGAATFNAGATFNGHVYFGDHDKAVFGAGSDLQIFHDGSNSYIQSATGNFNLTTAGGNEYALTAVNDGAVTIFHNGSAKLATTSTGIDVTGTVTTDGLTSSGPINLTAGALAAAGNAGLSHRSSDNKVYLQAGTGGFHILDDQQNTHFSIDSAGASTFNGNVGIGTTTTPGAPLHVNSDTEHQIKIQSTASAGASMQLYSGGSYSYTVYQHPNANFRIGAYGGSSFIIRDQGNSADRLAIINNGNVGIGTTSPTAPLSLRKVHATGYGSGIDMLDFKAYYPPNYDTETSKASIFVGTSDKHTLNTHGGYLAFKVNSSGFGGANSATSLVEYMRIEKDGNVGIGTTNPGSKLHVQTSHTQTDVTGANSNSTLNIANSGAGNGIYNAIKFAANQQDMYIMSFNNNQQAARRLGFFLGSVAGDATTDERLSILGNGNVGIGTTTPDFPLEIEHGTPQINLKDTSSSGQFRFLLDGTTAYIQNHSTNGDLILSTTGSGNVGIGTSSPDTKLQVSGDISTAVDGNAYQLYYTQARDFITNSGATAIIKQIDNDATNAKINFNSWTNSTLMTIMNSGNVGIGTSSPAVNLHINKGATTYQPAAGVVKNYFALNTDYNAAGIQGVYLSQLDGNWIDGTSGADSAFGMLFGYANATRGGLIYDHRGSERLQLFSSYGALAFITPNAADGDGVPTDSNMVERLTILPGGNVGIGTTSPSAKLQVATSNSKIVEFVRTGTSTYNFDLTISDVGEGAAQLWFNAQTNDTGFNFRPKNSSGTNTNALYIAPDGDVGIGTTSPGARLHAYTTGYPVAKFERYGSSTATRGWTQLGHSSLGYSGATGADTYIVAQHGIGFAINEGTNAMTITDGGKVGIGTNNPTAKLEVEGAFAGTISKFFDTGSNGGAQYNGGPVVGISRVGNGSVSLAGPLFQVGNDTSSSTSYNIDEAVFTVTNTGVRVGNTSSNSTGIFAVGVVGVSGVNASAAVHGLSGDAALVVTNTNLADSSAAYGWTGRGGRYLTSNGTNWTSDGKDPGLVIGSADGSTQRRNLGIVLHNENQSNSTFSPGIFFGNRSNSGQYNTGYGYIMGRKTGSGVDTNWSTGEIHMDTAGPRTGTTSRNPYMDNNPAFKIDSNGDINMPYKAYAYGTIAGNPTSITNGYGIALTTTRYQNCTPQTNSGHGPGITITKAGFYILNMSFLYDPAGSYIYSGWCVNGTQIHHWHSNHTVSSNHDAVSQIGRYLNIGDHVTIENSSQSISVIYGNTHSSWYIAKIG